VAPPLIALLLLAEVCVALVDGLVVADAVAVAVLAADDALEPDADAVAPACRVPTASNSTAARTAPVRCATEERTGFKVVITYSPGTDRSG